MTDRLLPYSWDLTLKAMRAMGYGGERLAQWLIRNIALDNLKSEFKEEDLRTWFILTPKNPDDPEFMAVDPFRVAQGGSYWASITYMDTEFRADDLGVALLAAAAYAAGRLKEGSDEWHAGRGILGRERMLDALGI